MITPEVLPFDVPQERCRKAIELFTLCPRTPIHKICGDALSCGDNANSLCSRPEKRATEESRFDYERVRFSRDEYDAREEFKSI